MSTIVIAMSTIVIEGTEAELGYIDGAQLASGDLPCVRHRTARRVSHVARPFLLCND